MVKFCNSSSMNGSATSERQITVAPTGLIAFRRLPPKGKSRAPTACKYPQGTSNDVRRFSIGSA